MIIRCVGQVSVRQRTPMREYFCLSGRQHSRKFPMQRGRWRLGARRFLRYLRYRTDAVIPKVSVRQWVLSFPIPLRSLFAVHPELLAPALQIIHRATSHVPVQTDRPEARSGRHRCRHHHPAFRLGRQPEHSSACIGARWCLWQTACHGHHRHCPRVSACNRRCRTRLPRSWRTHPCRAGSAIGQDHQADIAIADPPGSSHRRGGRDGAGGRA